jgi:glucose/arabinose dehydrogenase
MLIVRCAAVVSFLMWAGCGGAGAQVPAGNGPGIRLEKVISKAVDHPVCITHDGTQRLFIVEQPGRIRLMIDGQLKKPAYLDIHDHVEYGGEMGLLSVAFHPNFANNGLLYVNYTRKNPKLKTVISEFKVEPSAEKVDASSERVILTIDQPFGNHNGGQLQFGPDGYLYIGMGDGGARDDPHNNGQNPQSLLGKILRIDINQRDGNLGYGVPKDNPFVDRSDIRPEIWALGQRNPWRFTFDRETHTCYSGDVGQDTYEEVNVIVKGGNYGWNVREALHGFAKRDGKKIVEFKGAGPLIDPIKEYHHRDGLSITGGYVYRGKAVPALVGWYVYADYSSGRIWGLKYEDGKVTGDAELLKQNVQPTSFGEDLAGEMYICDYGGSIWRIVGK